MFNEFAIAVSTYHFLFFSPWVSDEIAIYNYGWSCIFIISIYILVNQFLIIRVGLGVFNMWRIKQQKIFVRWFWKKYPTGIVNVNLNYLMSPPSRSFYYVG